MFKELYIEMGFEDDDQYEWLDPDYTTPQVPHEDNNKMSIKALIS